MRCSNCGNSVPFAGNDVCPYCRADKSRDQKIHVFALVCGLVFGVLGFWLHGIVGVLMGLVFGVIFSLISKKVFKSKW
jgi:hypothetical protein